MIESELHPMSEAYSIYLCNQIKLYKEKVIMNLSLEEVFRLQILLYIKNLMHFNSVIYTDKTHIAAISRLLRDCWRITFVTLNGFCLLSKPNQQTPITHPPVLNAQYQSG